MSFTLEEIADAIEKNGFAQTTGDYHKYDNGKELFCAVGMGAYNLGIEGARLEQILNNLGKVPNDTNGYFSTLEDEKEVSLGVYIVYLNDGRQWTFKQIADWLREFASNKEVTA